MITTNKISKTEIFYLIRLRIALRAEIDVMTDSRSTGLGHIARYIKTKFNLTGDRGNIFVVFNIMVRSRVNRYNKLYNANGELEYQLHCDNYAKKQAPLLANTA